MEPSMVGGVKSRKCVPYEGDEAADWVVYERVCEAAGEVGYDCTCSEIGETLGKVLWRGGAYKVTCSESSATFTIYKYIKVIGEIAQTFICVEREEAMA